MLKDTTLAGERKIELSVQVAQTALYGDLPREEKGEGRTTNQVPPPYSQVHVDGSRPVGVERVSMQTMTLVTF